jgi:hypothetical protein
MNGYAKAQNRDKGCVICNSPKVQMHHVIFRSRGGNDSDLNLVSLCKRHHDMAHRNQPKFEKIFMEYLESHYGKLNKKDMRKKDRYSNYAYPKFK